MTATTVSGHGETAVASLLNEDEREVSVVISDPSRPDNPLIFVSEEFERQTGYPAAEALGRNCRFLQGRARTPGPWRRSTRHWTPAPRSPSISSTTAGTAGRSGTACASARCSMRRAASATSPAPKTPSTKPTSSPAGARAVRLAGMVESGGTLT